MNIKTRKVLSKVVDKANYALTMYHKTMLLSPRVGVFPCFGSCTSN